MKIHVQTLDRKIWRKELLTEFLYKCYINKQTIEIDFAPEGSCATALGLYRLLDEFCLRTGYNKNQITINTGNMIEQHPDYIINKQASSWYEVNGIQEWLHNKVLNINTTPTKHFANFSSRSNWYRLWIATILNKYYNNKTIQTYHYDPLRENANGNGYIGLDDLINFKCDIVVDAVEFIKTCPRTIDIEYLQNLDNCKNGTFQHENSYYPIQHPTNLNLLQYYNDIFVDIICEPNVSGNCFLVTEKLWRCIIAKRPFIVMSNPNYLANLRKLGFKTFAEFWSEEYDLVGIHDRITHIEKLLNSISNWPVETLHTKLNDMQLILDHNYNNFLNLSINQIQEIFNEDI
jgi:hypothetical protein